MQKPASVGVRARSPAAQIETRSRTVKSHPRRSSLDARRQHALGLRQVDSYEHARDVANSAAAPFAVGHATDLASG